MPTRIESYIKAYQPPHIPEPALLLNDIYLSPPELWSANAVMAANSLQSLFQRLVGSTIMIPNLETVGLTYAKESEH